MRRSNTILLSLLLMATACSSDDDIVSVESYKIITADIVDEATRTSLAADGCSVFWSPDDSLSVFLGSKDMNCAVVYGVPDGLRARFIVDDFILGGTAGKDEGLTNVALYPYDASAELVTIDSVKSRFPSFQRAVVNSIPDYSPMVAAVGNVSTSSFSFRNVCAFIRFNITSAVAADLSHIVLISHNKPIAGDVLYHVVAGVEPHSKVVSNGVNTITLDCNGLSIGSQALVVYMALLPVGFEQNGWSVELFDKSGSSMNMSLPAFDFERNKLYTLNVNYVPD